MTDPQEIRLRRSPRGEAVRRAARLLGASHPLEAGAPVIVDEAFADLATGPASVKPVEAASIDLAQITTQLKQLDEQRERLASLLSDLDSSNRDAS